MGGKKAKHKKKIHKGIPPQKFEKEQEKKHSRGTKWYKVVQPEQGQSTTPRSNTDDMEEMFAEITRQLQ